MVTNNSTNDYANSRFIVSATPGQGNYTTIQSAINAAALTGINGITVWVKEGSYVEDLTLANKVNVSAVGNNMVTATFPAVTVAGLVSAGTGVSSSIYGLAIYPNGSYAVEAIGGGLLYVNDCFISALSGTGVHVDGSNMFMNNCKGVAEDPDSWMLIEGGGLLRATYTSVTGQSTVECLLDGGYFECINCYFSLSFLSRNGGQFTLCANTVFDTSSISALCINVEATAGISRFYECSFFSGTAPAITIDAGGVNQICGGTINSTSGTVITGLGEVQASGISFPNSGAFNITTLRPFDLGPIIVNFQQPISYAYLSTSTANNVTGDGTPFQVICDAFVPDTYGSYDGTTGIYTAKFTGNYNISWIYSLANISIQTGTQGYLVISSVGTVMGGVAGISDTSGGVSTATGSMSVTVPLVINDTIQFWVVSNGGTKTVGVAGGSSPAILTFLSVNLVN